jgi:hypothetical protein
VIPQHPVSVRLEDRLLVCVVLTGELVVVPGRAVGFDHQSPVAPEEIGDDRSALEHELLVDLRTVDSRRVDEIEDEVLELAARRGGAVGDHRPQRGGTGMPVCA